MKKCTLLLFVAISSVSLLSLFAVPSRVHAQAALARPAAQFALRMFGVAEEGSEAFAESQLLRHRREIIESLESKGIGRYQGPGTQLGQRAFSAGAAANDNDAAVAAARKIAQERLAGSEAPAGAVQSDDVLAMCGEKDPLKQKAAHKRLFDALSINALGLGSSNSSAEDHAAETVRIILNQCGKFLSGEYRQPNAVAHTMLKNVVLHDFSQQTPALVPLFSFPDGLDMESALQARDLLCRVAEGLTPRELEAFNEWMLGSKPAEIAAKLGIRPQAAYNYVYKITSRLKAVDGSAAAPVSE